MPAALSYNDVATLCSDSLALAERIERCGGPPPHRAEDFYRARQIVENAQDELQSGLGFAPLVLIPWLLLGVGTIVGVATIPKAIEGTRQVVGATTGAVSGIANTIDNAIRWASYAGVGLGTYWALRKITKSS